MKWNSEKNLLLLHKVKAFSLIEVMISLAILSVILVGTLSFFSNRLNEQKNLMLRSAKMRVIKQMEHVITDPAHIKSSLEVLNGSNATHNMNFLRCLMSAEQCPANYLDKTNPKNMDYFMADGSGGYNPITGFWSKEGASGCLPPEPDNCPMQMNVKFWLTCASDRQGAGTSSCSELSHVNLFFQIRPTIEDSESNQGVNFHHPTTSAQITNPDAFSVSIPVKDILSLFAQSCLSYHYMDGYGNDGRVICRCLNNRTQRDSQGRIIVDAVGRPLCESNQCQPEEIFLGFETDSNQEWRPVCLGESMKKHCYKINLKTTPECAENYWITHIEYGKCDLINATTKKKVYTQDDVTCEDDSATCCRQYE
ncbi:MAG: type IV pilus modification PilV family protein [Oligoflexus sp.]